MFTERVTITMPVFERTEFFAEALQSALRQTVSARIVVVDNASSHDFFKDYVARLDDPFVSYVRNPENLGLYGNWNRCSELATSQYFMILGDDDVMQPSYIESFLEAHSNRPSIAAYFSRIERFGDAYDGVDPTPALPVGYVTGVELLHNACEAGLNLPTVAMTLSRQLFSNNAFKYPQWAYSQDWLFVYRALAHELCFIDTRQLLKYRVHNKGNALIVGVRAELSSALIYGDIKVLLEDLKHFKHAQRARKREKWVPRNVVINGNRSVLKEMLAEEGNPFGDHLSALIADDFPLRLAMGAGTIGRLSTQALRAQRLANRLFRLN